MSATTKTHRLISLELRIEQDIVFARQRARQIAAALGFEPLTETRIATALSEIARNAFQYAGGGRIEFFLVLTEPVVLGQRRVRQTLVISVRDTGPGIVDLEGILAGRYRSASGLGLGIMSTHRLMDRVEISTTPAGTTVTLAKIFPPSAPTLGTEQLQAVMDRITRAPVTSPFEEVQLQNQELIRALDAARERQEELARVNQELAETNAGVLALYDELDTLHRVGTMLASKLELKPLIQAIIDVTTSLTSAELGAFYLQDERGRWSLYATSGTVPEALAGHMRGFETDLFGPDFAVSSLVHIADLREETEAAAPLRIARIATLLAVRSFLMVPVLEENQTLIGALVFTSSQPRAFSERSERILASIATQAAVGIEKARLFQNVTAANEAKDQFFAALSHELRTPLNPALAIVSGLLTNPRLPEELHEEIGVVARNIRLEARLIDDLLDFNRLIKGKLQLAAVSLRIHALIEDVVAICREELEAKSHRLNLKLDAPDHPIIADPARIQQVLWNVLKNAIKFTEAGGALTIGTEKEGSTLRITVSDNGRGIEPAALSRIFEAFDQGEVRLASQFGGLGLGLSIARMFVELHKGKIFAASAGLEQGTTITIELPITDVPVDPAHPTKSSATTALEAVNSRILLVDDHADTLQGLTRLLTRRGYQLTPVASGKEALAAARAGTFDLIISDVGLTDCSGLDLIRDLRAIQSCPAIALSGYGMESDIASSASAGFQLHITKPVDTEQLIRGISSLLAKSAE